VYDNKNFESVDVIRPYVTDISTYNGYSLITIKYKNRVMRLKSDDIQTFICYDDGRVNIIYGKVGVNSCFDIIENYYKYH
jgi:hypothetical protein